MNKVEKELEELFVDFYVHAQDSDACEQLVVDTLKLFTPKLQWKSQEITNNGGSNLVAAIYSLKDYHCSIQIYDHVDKLAQVHWNHRASFTGSLEECKKFCSDKILNDFLKLCE